MNISDRWKSNK